MNLNPIYEVAIISSIITSISFVAGSILQWYVAKRELEVRSLIAMNQRGHEFIMANFGKFAGEAAELIKFIYTDGRTPGCWTESNIFSHFQGASWALLGSEIRSRLFQLVEEAKESKGAFSERVIDQGEQEWLKDKIISQLDLLASKFSEEIL